MYGWKIILLPGEIQRIAEFTGEDPSYFIDNSPLTQNQLEFYTENTAEDPLWAQLFSAWTKPTGLKGSCSFLKREGCSLPYHIKPLLCQIYPLDFNITKGTLLLKGDMDCLLLQSVRSADEVSNRFEDNMDDLQLRFEAFRNEFLSLLTRDIGMG
jgi:Fe-S-cluster containining protein